MSEIDKIGKRFIIQLKLESSVTFQIGQYDR
jgi:hypothetical protein